MAWGRKITQSFAAIPPNSPKDRYLGPWNKILNLLFPFTTDFMVHPHCSHLDDNNPADFIPWFEVNYKNLPVLVVEVATPSDRDSPPACGQEKSFMRDHLRDYARTCRFTTLHGISAMGTQVAFYNWSKYNPEAEIIPHVIPQLACTKDDFGPREPWSLDVFSEEAEARIRRMANDIQVECAALEFSELMSSSHGLNY